jgi:mRNA interferase RelE/StbE
MGYSISYRKQPLKYLDGQPPKQRERIIASINELPDGNVAPMAGRMGFRLRVGEYRILFRLDHAKKTIVVEAIGNRGDVYK